MVPTITLDLTQTAETTGRKDNKSFMILSALGILFVVDVHLGFPLSVLTRIFPYDSFFMPMFAFISGYFFKEKNCRTWRSVLDYAITKFQKLVLPYLGWILFYCCLNELLYRLGIWEIRGASLQELIYGILTSGIVFAFNSPAWFAPALFCVSCTYCLIRRLFRKHWHDGAAMLVLVILGTAAVYGAGTNFNTPLHYMLLKIPFFLQFYHMGLFFRNRIESWFDRTGTVTVCLSTAFCNLFLIGIYGNGIEFPVCSSMGGFQTSNPLLPLITSITGIAFWLKISKGLVPILGKNKLINFISDNTFFIMTHHIGVKHLFIGLCALGYQLGITACSGIDMQQFLTDGLYLYNVHPWCIPASFVFTMVVLILGCKAYHAICDVLTSFFKQKKP